MKPLISVTVMFLVLHLTCYSQTKQGSRADTLNVAYTYWWPYGGPFIGMCGDQYSLVFVGTIIKLDKPSKPHTLPDDSTLVLSTPQKGVIKIKEIKFKSAPSDTNGKKKPLRKYAGQSFFVSDCFLGSDLRPGDNVMVFIYSYEGHYSIPWNSILKVKDFDDPLISSIEKYIKNNQDPLVISADTTLWKKHGFDEDLKRIIDCRSPQE